MLERYCRLCAVKKPSLTYIFDSEGIQQNLGQKIQTNLQIPINENDQLPKRVCATCLKKLNKFSNFAHDCRNAQIRLRELVSQCATDAEVTMDTFDPKSDVTNGNIDAVFLNGNNELLADVLEPNSHSSIPVSDKVTEVEEIVIKSESCLGSSADVEILARPVGSDEEWEISCSPVDLVEENDSRILQKVVNEVCTLVKLREIHSDIENITTFAADLDTLVSVEETGSCEKHIDVKPFSCSDCQRTFSSKSKLQQHMRIHSGKSSFRCSSCPRSFTRRQHLARHMYVHSGVKPFKCEVCNTSFTRKCSLEKHARVHGVKKEKPEQLPKPQMFTEYPDGDKPFICNLCGASFARRNYVQQHAIVHAVERPFACTVCAYTFARPQHLARHMRTHTGEKPYQCPTCKSSFSRKSYLREHAKIHDRQKSVTENANGTHESTITDAQCTCEICGNSFSHIKYLRQHYRTHTGEKPFGCHDCGSSFARKHHLRRHIRIHTGEKPFLCSICGTRFARKFYLKVHSITHSDEKPFICNVCGSSFARNTSLQQHMKTHVYVEPL